MENCFAVVKFVTYQGTFESYIMNCLQAIGLRLHSTVAFVSTTQYFAMNNVNKKIQVVS